MRRVVILILTFLLIVAISADARTIKLKNGFFSGWQYSVDGDDYVKVGMTGGRLASEMEGNKPAVSQMSKYKSDKTAAMIFGAAGGFFIGYPLGGMIGAGWEDEYGFMLGAGGALAIVGIIFESASTSHLKQAVSIFNGEESGIKVEIICFRNRANFAKGSGVALAWRF